MYISATEWKLIRARQDWSWFSPLPTRLQLLADIETCFVGGGRVLQGVKGGRLDVYYDNPVSVKMV